VNFRIFEVWKTLDFWSGGLCKPWNFGKPSTLQKSQTLQEAFTTLEALNLESLIFQKALTFGGIKRERKKKLPTFKSLEACKARSF
jgi:hypothetical protein